MNDKQMVDRLIETKRPGQSLGSMEQAAIERRVGQSDCPQQIKDLFYGAK